MADKVVTIIEGAVATFFVELGLLWVRYRSGWFEGGTPPRGWSSSLDKLARRARPVLRVIWFTLLGALWLGALLGNLSVAIGPGGVPLAAALESSAGFLLLLTGTLAIAGYLIQPRVPQRPALVPLLADDFAGSLTENWHCDSGHQWEITPENDLVIPESDRGIVSKVAVDPREYTFMFRARVICGNLGVVIDAKDQDNYLMLQLTPEYVRPHHRSIPHQPGVNSPWKVNDAMIRRHDCDIGHWFTGMVVARGKNVTLYLNGRDVGSYARLPGLKACSVGFRCGRRVNEKAEVRWMCLLVPAS